MEISIIDIKESTSVDGPGLRTSIYCAGCEHACVGCHNPQSWNMGAGEKMNIDDVVDCVLKNESEDLTFSGGDPMFQAEQFAYIAKRVKRESSKNIWCYTGFTFERLLKNPKKKELLNYIDVLVDGRYNEKKRDPNLLFRGSSNQRIIDVQKSLCHNTVVELKIDNVCEWLR